MISKSIWGMFMFVMLSGFIISKVWEALLERPGAMIGLGLIIVAISCYIASKSAKEDG